MFSGASRASRPWLRSGFSFLTAGIGRVVWGAKVCAAVLGAVVGGGGTAHAQCPFTFGAPVNYPTGVHALSVAVADFNCDGVPDLAVANLGNNNVSILLGNGPTNPGTFQAAVNYPVGAGPRFIAAGDFNGDGRPDLAVANQDGNTVSILLAYPNGTFRPAVNYAVGLYPACVVVGDFNGDGLPDLAVANYTSNNVSILLGTPTGTFAPAVNYFTGSGPVSIAIADFNGDGRPDLVVTDYFNNTVSILRADPAHAGTFQTRVAFSVGSGPFFVAAGDFNSDGRPDLAVANITSNNISILLGNAAGGFVPAVNYFIGPGASPDFVAIGDFNADGNPDLAVSNYTSGTVTFFTGNGNGTFLAVVNQVVGTGPFCFALADLNGDGTPDLASANYGGGNVSVLLGNTGGALFGAAVNYGAGNGARSVAIADFDGDGRPDLAVANQDGANVSILLAHPDGTFRPAVNYDQGAVPISIAAGDFDGDGRLDLVTANYGTNDLTILLGNGDGTFFHQPTDSHHVGAGPTCVVVGDFDGNQFLDLAVTNYGDNNVSILRGNGNGTFQAAENHAVGAGPSSIAVMNSGRDLAVTNTGSNNVSILRGDGSGGFLAAINFPVGLVPRSVAVGDFNADGVPDLAVTVSTNESDHHVSILLGNPDGTFQAAVTYTVRLGAASVAVGDFNGDGRLDLAVTNEGDNSVSILLGNGPPNAGTFQPAMNYTVDTDPLGVVIGDFNADGRPDLAVANHGSNNVSVLLNANTATYPAPTIIQQPRASRVVQAGQTAALAVIADGHGRTLTYQWRRNGVPIANGGRFSGATSPTLTITQALASDTATYDVRISAPGCGGGMVVTTSNPGTITVIGNPACTADFNHDGFVNSQDFFDFLTAFFAGC
jgi:hypothetical protein